MKALFMTLLSVLHENENVKEALLYESGKYASIKYETLDGTYTISISKENENGDL